MCNMQLSQTYYFVFILTIVFNARLFALWTGFAQIVKLMKHTKKKTSLPSEIFRSKLANFNEIWICYEKAKKTESFLVAQSGV